ncbi:uncharacterized protein HD556DRAFT_1311014 [Suillus plorans]|uniref:Uncharacterized protein n=1 Tax=Suillus plorans TaxID=116603 RepID=A0A9P7AHX0_9AGAM|nr:uncharacterized protein HD556DRAFT_1311014 [Suillus plorans]KAG1789815.1 hypothetical protein HD556DRAFT_1311014 [Suillus plorans]
MTNTATPKQHMITDSRENKCTRQQPEQSDMSESEDEGQGSNKKQATKVNAAPPTTTQPVAQPAPPANPWHFLQTGAPNGTNTVNGVITLHNGLKITAPPTGGFPSPQLGQSVWRNVAPALRERWPQKAGPKPWVRTFRAKYEDNMQMTNIKMRNLIALTIGETAAAPLLLSTPSAEGDLYERLPPPYHFLISSISQPAVTRLTGLGICSSPEITCFFIPYNQPLPNYICTLERFTLPDCAESNAEIASLVKQTIHMHPNISLFIHDHIPTPNAEAAIKVMNSIRIASLTIAVSRTISHTVWNVYADSLPNMSLKDYFEWTNLIRNLQFASEDYGTGLVQSEEKQFLCTGCKSYDHPTGLCPFPKVLGWFGPVSATEDTANASLDNRTNNNQSRGNSSRGGRGTVGRGRGCGRRGRGQY